MTISGDRILHRATVVKPLVLDLLDNLVHIENEHEPGKKPHNDFYMAKTTVSQALWTALMGDNPSVFPKKDEDLRKFPVDEVFLDDCRVIFSVAAGRMVRKHATGVREKNCPYEARG
jgi:hypothetical protein